MELFELLEWLLPAGTLSGIQPGTESVSVKKSIERIKTEEDLFSFIQAVLQPYLHAFTLLIGMADTNGVITQWWLQKEGALNIGELPTKIKAYYLEDNIAGLMQLDSPDRSDALKSVFYRSGVKESLLLPLGNVFRNFGFLCMLSGKQDLFPQSLQSKLKE